MEPNTRISDLVTITDRLNDILTQENQALRSHEHSKISELIEDKANISRIYEAKYKALEEETDLLKTLGKDQRKQLKNINLKVNRLIEENGMLLNVAIEANQNVMNLVAEAVREASIKTENYGSSGRNALSGPRAEAQSIAFSLDQTL